MNNSLIGLVAGWLTRY